MAAGGVAAGGVGAAARADAAPRRADGPSRGTIRRPGPTGSVLGAIPEAWWTEGRTIRIDIRWQTADADFTAPLREGTRRAATGRHSIGKHAADCGAATDKRAPSRLCSPLFPIRSAQASSRACRGRAATSPGFSISKVRWAASGWSCLSEIAPRVARVAFLYNPTGGAVCRVLPQAFQNRRSRHWEWRQ